MKKRNSASINFNIITDILGVALALLTAYIIRQSGWPITLVHTMPSLDIYTRAIPAMAAVLLITYQYAGLYVRRRGVSGIDEFSRITKATTVAFLVLVGLTYFYSRVTYSRVVLIYAWVLTITFNFLFRALVHRLQVLLRRRGIGVLRVAVVGKTPAAKTVAEQIKTHPDLGYQFIGIVDEQTTADKEWEAYQIIGDLKELTAIIRKQELDEIIFALPASAHDAMEKVLLTTEELDVEFKIVSDLFGIITNPMMIDEIYGIPIFSLKESALSKPVPRMLKRTLDFAVSFPALVLLAPFMLLVALLVKLTSSGPVFFKQERVGRGNQPFMVYKFRSMHVGAESETGPVWAKKDDKRTTAIGGFLRKTSIDELPQLFNVLKGEMSMVGPRPERRHFVNQFKTYIPRYLERHKVKAGITGWAQVNGLRGNTPIEERTKYDLWYVENWSVWLDIKLIIRTAFEVLKHEDAY